MTTRTELIERMMTLTEVEEFLALVHPDAEYQPRPDAPVFHGLAEIREWAEREAADPARPQALPVSVTETADAAVIRGQVKYHPRQRREAPQRARGRGVGRDRQRREAAPRRGLLELGRGRRRGRPRRRRRDARCAASGGGLQLLRALATAPRWRCG